jgi:hypothetical protein
MILMTGHILTSATICQRSGLVPPVNPCPHATIAGQRAGIRPLIYDMLRKAHFIRLSLVVGILPCYIYEDRPFSVFPLTSARKKHCHFNYAQEIY